jgi:hypothetical protein
MAVEYFMKWVEAKPVTNITSSTIKMFFSQIIICQCGIPRHISVDNAKYFDSTMFKDFCQQVRLKGAFASIYHPQSNGVVERAKALIFDAIEKILEVEKKANGPKSCQG